jgi:hypothetical protein
MAVPGGGPFLRLFISWTDPRSPSRRERRNGAGRKGPRRPAGTHCAAARRGARRLLPPPAGDSSARLLLPGRYRSHRPAPGTAGWPRRMTSMALPQDSSSRNGSSSGRQNGEAAAEKPVDWMAMRIGAQTAQRRDRSQRRRGRRTGLRLERPGASPPHGADHSAWGMIREQPIALLSGLG